MEMTRRDFTVMASGALAAPSLGAGTQGGGTQGGARAQGPRTSGPNRVETGPPRVLVVSAHCADFCSRSGGTLIKYVKAGFKVKVIWLSHGVTNESQLLFQQRPGISFDEVRRVREKEGFACAKVIGAEAKMLGFDDDPLRMTPERVDQLAKEIAAFGPTVILSHFKEVTYASHYVVGQSAISAAHLANGSWNIHFFEPNIGTATRVGFVPDHYVDITDVMDQKIAALKELPTQPNLVENYTSCNRWRGLEANCKYAEGFVRWMPKSIVNNLLE
jgi:4-oxalomesaconate hydratase